MTALPNDTGSSKAPSSTPLEPAPASGEADLSPDLDALRATGQPAASTNARHIEQQYADDIVNTMREGVLVLDEHLRVQAANDAFYALFQLTPEEVAERIVYELGGGQWDRPALHTLLDDTMQRQQRVTDYDLELHTGRSGDEPCLIRLNVRRIDHARIVLAIEDVTERETATQQLRAERNFIDRVLNTVGALIAVVDLEGCIVQFNSECEAVTGYAAEEAVGKNVLDLLVPPEERDGVLGAIDIHRKGQDQTTHENHWITKDGTRRLIRWSSTALRGADGQVQHVIGTGIDITERRRMEREMVTVSDEERRRIGQDLHDMLASQLAGIAMMARSMAHKVDRDAGLTANEVRTVADLINEAGEQARALSHSLMPLSVQGNELTAGLKSLVKRQEKMTPDVRCSFEAGASLPPLSGEVASHLYRMASEAVSNAIKHGAPQTVTIRLTVDAGYLVLSIRDDGVGIPAEHNSTDGLGLHMMQYRAELIGARLAIEPAGRGGTIVRCRIPLERVAPSKAL